MKKDKDQKIEEAQIVQDEWVDLASVPPVEADEDKKEQSTSAETKEYLQLDVLIRRYISTIEKLKKQMNEQRALYNDSFKNDGEYHDKEEQVKELNKLKQTIKQKITQRSAVVEASNKIKDIREQVKSAQDMLSGYLEQYVQKTGARTIEDNDGNVRQIVPSYKLVKRVEE